MAQLYRVIPLSLDGNRLTIASGEPQKIQIADELRTLLGYDIHVCVATDVEIQKAIEKYYSSNADSVESLVDDLELQGYHLWHATRGDLLERLGNTDAARDAFARAASLTDNPAERDLLEQRVYGTPSG